jgi:hypothetical protein
MIRLMRAARSLAFPAHRSAGTLFGVGPDGRRRRLAAALGDVALPEGMRFGATISQPEALAAFNALRPRELEWIDLHKSPTLDHHLAPLGRLAGLREVNLSKASLVGDEGLAHLRHVWALRDLDLYRTGVGDHGLLHLRRLHSLERLHLGMTKVRGPGLVHLRTLQSLRWLSLEDTEADDDAVALLADLPSLREVVLRGTRATSAGVAFLRRANPACRVHGDLEHNQWRVRSEELRRELLTILVRRADPRASVHRGSPVEAVSAALNRLFPAGTLLASLAEPGTEAPGVTSPGWDRDLVLARRLNAWLLGLPEGCSIRVTPPGATAYEFPWITRSPTHRAGRC